MKKELLYKWEELKEIKRIESELDFLEKLNLLIKERLVIGKEDVARLETKGITGEDVAELSQ
jgi:hypothetical protein